LDAFFVHTGSRAFMRISNLTDRFFKEWLTLYKEWHMAKY
jgi:hypothetical protein